MNMWERLQRLSYQLRGDKRYVYYDELMGNLRLSRGEMISHQNKLISRLVSYAYKECRYYREVMDSLGLLPDSINCKESLSLLPSLTKDIIRESSEGIITHDFFGRSLEEVTSGGSTGNQITIYKSKYFTEISRAASIRNNTLCGWFPGDKAVWIWGAPFEHQKIKDSLQSRIGIFINRRLLFNAYRYKYSDFYEWATEINRYRPKVIYGYASIILEFSEFVLKEGIKFHSVVRIITTTETLRERELIEKAFNCSVFDQYGCREVLAVGVEVKKGCMIVADDVVSLAMEKDGSVLLTALHSYGFPLINYKVGDVIRVKASNECVEGYPFSAMSLEIGRETDNFISESGVVVSSSALSVYISTHKLPIKEYQLVQKEFKLFCVKYVAVKAEINQKYCSEVLVSILDEYFGPGVVLDMCRVEKLPVEKSGKKLLFKREFC